jgi:hypothetical protein
MPRFYFNLREDGRVVEDDEGTDLPDLAAAKLEATETATAMAREHLRNSGELIVEVRDERRKPVVVVSVEVRIAEIHRPAAG